jgi:hypothetical protein
VEAQAFLDLVKEAPDVPAVIESLETGARSLPGFQRVDSNNYNYMGFSFNITLEMYAARERGALQILNALEIIAAPTLVHSRLLSEGDTILITFRPNCENSPPLPLSQFKEPISGDARSRFLKDMLKLADSGLYHPYAGKGYAHWEVDPAGNLLLNSWSQLSRFDAGAPEAPQEELARISRLLERLK